MLPIRILKYTLPLFFLIIFVYSLIPAKAADVGVDVFNGRLYIDGVQFEVRGIDYNPVSIGTDQVDPTAPVFDVPVIARMHANTIGTYNVGKFEWGSMSDLTAGEVFYDALYPVAESHNLKIVVGYFSNSSIDWTDASRVTKVTEQYKALVLKTKSRPATLMYTLGNEVFEFLPNEAQKIAYAKWIGQMTDWTHVADPYHPVTYADNAFGTAIPYLKTYAPNLDLYSINDYEWGSWSDLGTIILSDNRLWDKPIFLHEWGVDSFNVNTWSEDRNAQAAKIAQLAQSINTVYDDERYPFIGSMLFEYSDQWDKVGYWQAQDPDQGWPWSCVTCFDAKANQDYWGITESVGTGLAGTRLLKPAYGSLATVWNDGVLPTVLPSVAPTVAPTLPPVVSSTALPTLPTQTIEPSPTGSNTPEPTPPAKGRRRRKG